VNDGVSIHAAIRRLERRLPSDFHGARRTEWSGLWLLVLIVAALQMTTVLRPIVGPSTHLFEPERQFFLQH
jgi:hypothetical protein